MQSDDRNTFIRLAAVLVFLTFLLILSLLFLHRIPLLGGLPGDLVFDFQGRVVFLPIGTCIFISLLLTLLMLLLSRSRNNS